MKKLTLLTILFLFTAGAGRTSVPSDYETFNELQISKSHMVGDGFEIRKAPDVSPDSLLEAIVAEHRGKVVFIDFWATWCMPCLMAMEEIKPLKKDMEANDVVTIYIASDSSPEPAWIGKLPGLGGIHYRLDTDQWRAICDKYDIKAIPQYMVFDNEGNKTYQIVGFPGTGKIRAQLKKVW